MLKVMQPSLILRSILTLAVFASCLTSFRQLTIRGAGLAFGDEGWWLIEQTRCLDTTPPDLASPYWLTNVVAASWTRATDHFGLAGARMGWVVINALAATLIFCAIAKRSKWYTALIAILVSAPIICTNQFPILEYNNVPWFFLLCSSLLGVIAVSRNSSPPLRLVSSILCGLFLGLGIHARIPTLFSLAIPFLPFLFHTSSEELRRINKQHCIRASISAAITISAGVALLLYFGALDSLGQRVMVLFGVTSTSAGSQVVQSSHSPTSLMKVYASNLLTGLEHIGLLILLLTLLTVAIHGLGKPGRATHILLLMFVASVIIAVGWIAPVAAPGLANVRFNNSVPLFSIAVIALAFNSWRSNVTNDEVRELLILGTSGLMIAFSVMAGSDLGFYRLLGASWLVAPVAIALIPQAASAINGISSRFIDISTGQAALTFTAVLFAIPIGYSAYALSYARRHTILSENSPKTLRTPFSHPRLLGIWDSQEVVAETESLLNELEAHVQPGDSILAYPNLEMVYFLSKTRPALFRMMFTHAYKNEIEEIFTANPPKVVIRRNDFSPAVLQYRGESLEIVDKHLKSLGYETTWTNKSFTIFKLIDRSLPSAR